MKLSHRRQFLHLAAGTAALPAFARKASAQSYPAKPVTLIIPLSAGTGMDLLARLYGEQLAQVLGKAVVVENKPGAATTIGASLLASASPDGHTLGVLTSGALASAKPHCSARCISRTSTTSTSRPNSRRSDLTSS